MEAEAAARPTGGDGVNIGHDSSGTQIVIERPQEFWARITGAGDCPAGSTGTGTGTGTGQGSGASPGEVTIPGAPDTGNCAGVCVWQWFAPPTGWTLVSSTCAPLPGCYCASQPDTPGLYVGEQRMIPCVPVGSPVPPPPVPPPSPSPGPSPGPSPETGTGTGTGTCTGAAGAASKAYAWVEVYGRLDGCGCREWIDKPNGMRGTTDRLPAFEVNDAETPVDSIVWMRRGLGDFFDFELASEAGGGKCEVLLPTWRTRCENGKLIEYFYYTKLVDGCFAEILGPYYGVQIGCCECEAAPPTGTGEGPGGNCGCRQGDTTVELPEALYASIDVVQGDCPQLDGAVVPIKFNGGDDGVCPGCNWLGWLVLPDMFGNADKCVICVRLTGCYGDVACGDRPCLERYSLSAGMSPYVPGAPPSDHCINCGIAGGYVVNPGLAISCNCSPFEYVAEIPLPGNPGNNACCPFVKLRITVTG